jgi:hypothetical protein
MLSFTQEPPKSGPSADEWVGGRRRGYLRHRDPRRVGMKELGFLRKTLRPDILFGRFKWVSSCDDDFNFEFGASFANEQIVRGEAFCNHELDSIPLF